MNRSANVFLNGTVTQYSSRHLKKRYTLAADGGIHNALQNGIRPDAIIGDADSFSPADYIDIPYVPATDQNYTDFEKSLRYLHEHGYSEVHVYCFAGDRFDHMLAGLSAAAASPIPSITLYTASQKVERLPYKWRGNYPPGSRLSFLPFPSAEQVSTSGLRWNVHEEDFLLGQFISISNEALGGLVELKYGTGSLFLVVSL